jgi:hypothetical protein
VDIGFVNPLRDGLQGLFNANSRRPVFVTANHDSNKHRRSWIRRIGTGIFTAHAATSRQLRASYRQIEQQ